ncbi:MAG TPA: nucleoside-diphosphate sugar epimerase/dehydratase [Syntrophales bacterium]|nr:nucleoside-diphosphate sugar epimerase/dehydratase [Syntrophales bacterium]HPI57403.1 nucleoside-diphosphate sugar epimerase/dehydratase [Syntrophales bacterium]HPN25467.1 nucleoside-diphosphate sugar epimerase/dehydratase [Syntrophales bacterium]HQM29949.1 nucleoside-diphosphate sugar epimerase/dehydratase [Syntrophales bacterium]
MRELFKNKNFYTMVIVDTALVAAAYILAYALRFEAEIPPDQLLKLKRTLPIIIPVKIAVFFAFHLYRGMWRYTSLVDIKNVILASSFSSILAVSTLFFLRIFKGFSRSVFIIDWGLTIFLIGGVRILIRIILMNHVSDFWSFLNFRRSLATKRKSLIIIGAGSAGEKVLREINDNPRVHINPVGFLDDDKGKQGMSIHSVPVLGTVDQMDSVPVDVDEILIAVPSAKSEQMRRIVDLCEKTGKKFRTLPSIGELIEGKVSIQSIREVSIEDLIGRDEIHLDQHVISQFVKDRRILVTGAGGSIGSELVRQIARFQPQTIGILDASEFNLYQIERECQNRFSSLNIRSFLTDIRDGESLHRIFSKLQPHIVFHAAAYKHVPMQELHPRETLITNVVGTKNLAEISHDRGVDHFVLVSTDKAVRPANIMGATKRLAEMIVQGMNEKNRTRFMAVRFGNVLRSSGSVIPLFQEQIAQGGPVTVTHPDVTRYFMSLSEAAQLILQAGAIGRGGEIFVLEMGRPVKILDIARDLIRLHGLEPEVDIPIRFIGLRPGEKLFEELITEGENIQPTAHKKIMVLRGETFDTGSVSKLVEEILAEADSFDPLSIKKKIKEVLPEYLPEPDSH